MKILIASDHAGFHLKKQILETSEFNFQDLGVNDTPSSDYPDVASNFANHFLSEPNTRGILICGSGVGVCIAANKFKGIRAAICHDTYSASSGVIHDDMNVLVLGGRVIGVELAKELIRSFLAADFAKNEERYARRLKKLAQLENLNFK